MDFSKEINYESIKLRTYGLMDHGFNNIFKIYESINFFIWIHFNNIKNMTLIIVFVER